MFKLNFIYHRFEHHSSHSGYDRLTHYIAGNTIDGQIPLWFSGIIPKKITKLILKKTLCTLWIKINIRKFAKIFYRMKDLRKRLNTKLMLKNMNISDRKNRRYTL